MIVYLCFAFMNVATIVLFQKSPVKVDNAAQVVQKK